MSSPEDTTTGWGNWFMDLLVGEDPLFGQGGTADSASEESSDTSAYVVGAAPPSGDTRTKARLAPAQAGRIAVQLLNGVRDKNFDEGVPFLVEQVVEATQNVPENYEYRDQLLILVKMMELARNDNDIKVLIGSAQEALLEEKYDLNNDTMVDIANRLVDPNFDDEAADATATYILNDVAGGDRGKAYRTANRLAIALEVGVNPDPEAFSDKQIKVMAKNAKTMFEDVREQVYIGRAASAATTAAAVVPSAPPPSDSYDDGDSDAVPLSNETLGIVYNPLVESMQNGVLNGDLFGQMMRRTVQRTGVPEETLMSSLTDMAGKKGNAKLREFLERMEDMPPTYFQSGLPPLAAAATVAAMPSAPSEASFADIMGSAPTGTNDNDSGAFGRSTAPGAFGRSTATASDDDDADDIFTTASDDDDADDIFTTAPTTFDDSTAPADASVARKLLDDFAGKRGEPAVKALRQRLKDATSNLLDEARVAAQLQILADMYTLDNDGGFYPLWDDTRNSILEGEWGIDGLVIADFVRQLLKEPFDEDKAAYFLLAKSGGDPESAYEKAVRLYIALKTNAYGFEEGEAISQKLVDRSKKVRNASWDAVVEARRKAQLGRASLAAAVAPRSTPKTSLYPRDTGAGVFPGPTQPPRSAPRRRLNFGDWARREGFPVADAAAATGTVAAGLTTTLPTAPNRALALPTASDLALLTPSDIEALMSAYQEELAAASTATATPTATPAVGGILALSSAGPMFATRAPKGSKGPTSGEVRARAAAIETWTQMPGAMTACVTPLVTPASKARGYTQVIWVGYCCVPVVDKDAPVVGHNKFYALLRNADNGKYAYMRGSCNRKYEPISVSRIVPSPKTPEDVADHITKLLERTSGAETGYISDIPTTEALKVHLQNNGYTLAQPVDGDLAAVAMAAQSSPLDITDNKNVVAVGPRIIPDAGYVF